MRIAIVSDAVYPYLKGGQEKKYYEICRRLVLNGHEITFFSQKWWEGPDEIIQDGIKIRAVVPALPLFNSRGTRSITTAFRFMLGLIKNGPTTTQEHFDIIDYHEYPMVHTIPCLLLSKLKHVCTVLTVNEVWSKWWIHYSGILAPVAMLIEILDKKISTAIFVNSGYVKKRVEPLRKDKSTIFVVHAGVDTNFYSRITSERLQFDCIFVGRLIFQKRVDLLVKAVAIVKKSSSNVSVCIIGAGSEEESLKNLAKELGVDENILFMGKIDDEIKVAKFLKSSKMFVYPTAPEGGWSLSILEGYAAGLPCISVKSTHIGSGEEIVLNGTTGLLAENLDHELIAEQILKILEDEQLRKRMSANALEFVKQYDWDIIASKSEELYKRLCNNMLVD
jgi:glycosyltransferase involved in cell wall biosynthesis